MALDIQTTHAPDHGTAAGWMWVPGLIFLYGANACGFPIEEFKQFINTKPTIEQFEFRMSSSRFKLSGVDKDTDRIFQLIYQHGTGFSLVEDARAYHPSSMRFFWGQFGDLYWTTFGPNKVVTATWQGNGTPTLGTQGPAALALLSLGMAQDALNLGICDLGANGGHWEGLSFSCPSNLTGAKIQGQLQLDDGGKPAHLLATYAYAGVAYHYRVSYDFDVSGRLPDFFPARISIENLDSPQPVRTTEYKIGRLNFSHRQLSFNDVDYTRSMNTNLPWPPEYFVFSNRTVYAVKAKQNGIKELEELRPKLVQAGRARERLIISVGLSSVAGIFLICWLWVTRKPQQSKTTTKGTP